ncbi:hypothetical protein B0H14DRAFT_2984084 [Mycena olivaceomarginata]|nr:hypothetical protein B0H14DRAFT_2984084 [Mycena olivaceomarginata]
MPTTGGVTNSGSATTPTTTPSSSEVPSEPVTASATPSRTGSNAMSSLTGQGHSTGNESQPGSGASQPPPSAPATSSLTPTHHPTSSGTHTDTGSGGSTPGTPQLTSSSSKSKTNLGAIAGEVIGAVFAALVIIFVWLRCRKVRRLAADPASGSRFLRIEDYYAMQDASPPSSTHQVNPFPVSVDRSVFKEHLHNNSETGLTGPSAASVLPPTDAHSDLFPFPQSEPAATDTSHYQGRPSADEGMIGNARSTSTDSRPSISSSEDND